MKLLVLADDDSVRHTIQTERADGLVSCGDIYESIILQVAQSIQCPRILAVKGNHDSGEPFPPPIVDLHLTAHTVDGVRFGGFNGSWRYKSRGHFLYEQAEVEQLLASFPPVDVFVAHNSPRARFTTATTTFTSASRPLSATLSVRGRGCSSTATSTWTRRP